MNLRLHAFESASRSNGPGLRAVVWFQGCTLNCSGCFNPETHDLQGGLEIDTADLAQKILEIKSPIEGAAISGGEPFQQPEALLDLLERLYSKKLSTLVFSGYTLEQFKQMPLGPAILGHLDVLIAGPYRHALHAGHGLLGSANQKIHLLTDRYRPSDFTSIPRCEVILHTDGSLTITGVRPLDRK